jgi:hypothetical protein
MLSATDACGDEPLRVGSRRSRRQSEVAADTDRPAWRCHRAAPPVERCRGTSPIHAASSRPDLKADGPVTVAVIAVAPMTPMPRIVSSRRLRSLARCWEWMVRCSRPITSCRAASCATIACSAWLIGSGSCRVPGRIHHDRNQGLHAIHSRRRDKADLGKMRAERVDELRPLADQQIPAPMRHESALLVDRLDGHEPHGRPRHRFANGRCIGSIVFRSLDIGLDVACRHQTNGVPSLVNSRAQ